MTRRERAEEAFQSGRNCPESILSAFSDLFPSDSFPLLLRSSSPFGGGMGRMRETCGALSGSFMVLGALLGYDECDDEKKKKLYSLVQEEAASFRSKNGSIVCRDLLSLAKGEKTEPEPEKRTREFYLKRPCRRLIGDAAEILEVILKREGKI